MKAKMQPLWDRQQQIWTSALENLPIRKFKHSFHSKHAEEKAVRYLDTHNGQKAEVWDGLQKRFMPLPASVLFFPRFRYVLTLNRLQKLLFFGLGQFDNFNL